MSDIVELYLNRQQENEIAPMVRQAVATGRNIVFLATAVPKVVTA